MDNKKLDAAPMDSAEVRAVLDKAQARFGKKSNMIKAMANSPVVAEIYLQIAENLAKGKLTPQMRELLAIATAGVNDCDYCVRAHAARGGKCGLVPEQMALAVKSQGSDLKTDVALKFAAELLNTRGSNRDVGIEALREAGWVDAEIAEIIAVVALNVFPNYFNKVTGTEIDFPEFTR